MIGFKEYTYGSENGGKTHRTWYLTINGIQFGSPMFSKKEVDESIKALSGAGKGE